MREEFYRAQIAEMLGKVDYKTIKVIYYFLTRIQGKAGE